MRIGVLGNEGSWYVTQLCRKATELGHTAVPLQFHTLRADIISGRNNLWFGDLNLSSLDAIIVRTMPPGSLEQVVCRMDFLAVAEAKGIRVINPPKAIECAVDKYLTTQRLAAKGVPVPDTILCETTEAAMAAFEALGGDVVVKPIFGAEGRGILRVSHPEMALRAFRTLERLQTAIYVQQFLKGPMEDIRIMLLDGKVLSSMKRHPAAGDFRANMAQNATAEPWNPTDQEVELAQKSARITGCVFSGIDIMYNEHQQPVVIEVNAVPGWKALQKTCRVDVPEKLLKWLARTS